MQSYIPLFREYIYTILEKETNISAKDWESLYNTVSFVNIVYIAYKFPS